MLSCVVAARNSARTTRVRRAGSKAPCQSSGSQPTARQASDTGGGTTRRYPRPPSSLAPPGAVRFSAARPDPAHADDGSVAWLVPAADVEVTTVLAAVEGVANR